MKIKAVIFDLDNTLYDEHQFVKSGYMAVSEYLSKKNKVDRKEFYKLLWNTFISHGREKVFNRALKKIGIYDKEKVKELVKVYRSHFPNIKPYRGTFGILSQLKRKYLLGLITDGIKSVQKRKVEALKIKDFFDLIIYTGQYGPKNYKPNTFPYLKILKKFKIKPFESLYVGDNPFKDFKGARKLGIVTVRILKGEYRNLNVINNVSDYKIKNLKELLSIL